MPELGEYHESYSRMRGFYPKQRLAHDVPSLNFNAVIPTPKTMSNGVDPKYEYCVVQREKEGRNRTKKERTHDHKSPKRARLSSRVPFDALQTIVVPEVIEKERKKLTSTTSAWA
jgi:hypothetical protein